MRGARRLIVAVAAWSLLHAAGASASRVEFVYVEPDEGNSSAGHVGLRVDDRVYHFQNDGFGGIVLRRETWRQFDYGYRILQNRSLQRSRLELSPEDGARIDEVFSTRFLTEQKQFGLLAAIRDDLALVERLRDPRSPDPGAGVSGAGYFFGPAGADDFASARLAALRERVRRERGADWLPRRRAALRERIRGLEPGPVGVAPARLQPEDYPVYAARFSERYREALQELLALQVLEEVRPLRRAATAAPPGGPPLDAAERALVARLAADLEDDVAGLVTSTRPDRGYALLVAMARLAAFEQSLEGGRFLVLDTFPDAARVFPADAVQAEAVFMAELADEAKARFARARAEIVALPVARVDHWAALEIAANHWAEFQRGVDGGPVRVPEGHGAPSRRGAPAEPRLPEVAPQAVAAAHAALRREAKDYEAALRRIYAYDLLERNCANEIFRTLEAALGPEQTAAVLGGRVDPDGGGHFVPALARDAVDAHWAVEENDELESFRKARLRRLYAEENDAKVYLREANTLSSTIYRRNPEDPFFVFFTDDAWWPRPLYGAVNLAAGIGQTLVGVFTLPFDRGRNLVQGARGAAFSLPELVFLNLRKGRMIYAESAARRLLEPAPD